MNGIKMAPHYFSTIKILIILLYIKFTYKIQFSSVSQSCPTLCDPMNCSTLSITNSWSLPKLMSIESVMPSSHLILCRPLILLRPPIAQMVRRWYRNINLLSIAYAFRPRLRSRLTLSGRAFLRKP